MSYLVQLQVFPLLNASMDQFCLHTRPKLGA